MEHLSFEQMKELIAIATDKGTFDYYSIGVSSLVTLIAVGMSYFFFSKHAVQVINEKVIEKEVEKLYEAVDSFFKFSDAAGLSFSLHEKMFGMLVAKKTPPDDFMDKFDAALNGVFDNIREIRKASFLLRALGENDVAIEIDTYREEAIKLRKELHFLMEEYKNTQDIEPLNIFLQNLRPRMNALDNKQMVCLDNIAKCKKKFKAIIK